MRGKTLILATAILLIAGMEICHAQQTRMLTLTPGADGVFRIQEIESILTSENDTIRVLVTLPTDGRPEGYADIDIRENDQIIMANGKRLKKVAELETLYGELETGAELKLGIRRGGKLTMTSFKKADPKSLPAGAKMEMVSTTDDVRPWLGTGLLLGEDKGVVYIERILIPSDNLQGDKLEAGDELNTLNGQSFKDLESFMAVYDKIEVGAKVTVEFTRNTKKMQCSFDKEEAHGKTMIRREVN